jgi:hypothetical protein
MPYGETWISVALHEIVLQNQAWARVELGMSRQEFRQLTPAEFKSVVQLWRDKRRRELRTETRQFGYLLYIICQAGRLTLPDGEPMPANFFTTKRRKRRQKPVIDQLLACFPAEQINDTRVRK